MYCQGSHRSNALEWIGVGCKLIFVLCLKENRFSLQGVSVITMGANQETNEVVNETPVPFSILSERHKKWTIAITALVTFLSPVSGSIYFPAINELARDLHVTPEKINLTITAFLVCIFPLLLIHLIRLLICIDCPRYRPPICGQFIGYIWSSTSYDSVAVPLLMRQHWSGTADQLPSSHGSAVSSRILG